ncbi:50S ribosomal protein L30e-like protein [Bombardia bombarda]|uniref:50S ribosomal protein L30e-like protein n=1 Tax=Bombardia bombarda TaxID=252184 RepID=A0AA40CF29_9PEZI|nr:50S ribosomal protein L30e-like protein [Bombardia bombarda]
MGSSEKIVDKVKKDKKSSKDKSEKKEKKSEKLSEGGITKDKKDKKKDRKAQDKLARALDAHLQADAAASSEVVKEEEEKVQAKDKKDPEDIIKATEELVPFALPLADDKAHKKIYKLIKKGAKLKAIHRGVKECEKAIKKCPLKGAGSKPNSAPGLVIIAGDISPMDVIMHFPILCEEHNVPYLFIKSRAELGVAACTKRATSVVMLKPEGKKPAAGAAAAKGEDAEMEDGDNKKVSPEEYLEAYKELSKLSAKQWSVQVEPWIQGKHPLQIEANLRNARQ